MVKKLENPFVVGRYMGDEYFCDREEETALLKKQLRNGRDVALISPRRMGKSGLIHHVFGQKEMQEKYRLFFVDIYSCSSLREMIYLLGRAIYEQLKPKRELWTERFFQVISSFKAGIKMDPMTGLPSFELGLGDITSPETSLSEIFNYLSTAEKPCVVAIDEFQQILRFKEKNVEALLRTHIQRCPNVNWIFAGSQQHLIQGMFLSPSRPFYQSVITTTLHPIPAETYRAFARGLFLRYGKILSPSVVASIYERFQGYTWYMQMVMNEVFDLTGMNQEANLDTLEQAIKNILQMQADNYREMLSLLTGTQKALLQAIAREGEVTEISSSAFVTRNSLGSPATVQSALRRLLDIDIVTRTESTYRISDFLFSDWLKINF